MTERRIKVLQIQNQYHIDATDLAEQIISALPSERYETTSLFLQGCPALDGPRSAAENSVYLGFADGALKGLRFKAMQALYGVLRKHRFDVVIAHRFKATQMMMVLNRLAPVSVCIGIIHGLGDFDRGYRKWQMRHLIKPNWRMVGVSQGVYDDLARAGCGFGEGNLRVIDNAIDVSQAQKLQLPKAQARQWLGLPESAFVFGAIGRLVPVKGHEYLIRAFADIADACPHAHLAIIGGGRLAQELAALVGSLGLVGRVHLLGQREDALRFVRAYDVYVMPSLSEGLPLALLEAMSAGLPVIGANIQSMRPLIEGCGGASIAPKDVAGLAAAMRRHAQMDRATLEAKGEQACRYLRRYHDIEPFRQGYRQLIDDTLIAVQTDAQVG